MKYIGLVVCMGMGAWMGGSFPTLSVPTAEAETTRQCVRYAKKRRCVRRCVKRKGKLCVKRSAKKTCTHRCLKWKPLAKATLKSKPVGRKIKITSKMSRRDRAIAGIQNYYQDIQTLCADFRQVFKYARITRPQKESGRFYFRKPSKLRMYYTKPEAKDFIYNGIMRTLWIYYPDDKEVKIKRNQSMSQIAVFIPFLQGSGSLTRSFKIREYPKRTFGKAGDILLELTPKKPQTVLRKLYLAVDPQKYLIRVTAFTTPSGNRNSFQFRNLRRNAACRAPLSMFRFKVPKGVEKTEH